MATLKTTKTTITMELNEMGRPQEMERAVAAVIGLEQAPITKMVITVTTYTAEQTAELNQTIDDALSGVPLGVDITVKDQSERSVERRNASRTAPLELVWSRETA